MEPKRAKPPTRPHHPVRAIGPAVAVAIAIALQGCGAFRAIGQVEGHKEDRDLPPVLNP